MLQTVQLGKLALGQGAPAICVPLAGRTATALLEDAARLRHTPAQLAEWRADSFENLDDIPAVVSTAARLRTALAGLPLLFTCRTQAEGGARAVAWPLYRQLNLALAQSGQADMLDLELAAGNALLAELVAEAHGRDVRVVLSRHCLRHTPPLAELLACLERMHALGADLPKLAVTPGSFADTLRLMDAADRHTRASGRPVIAVAMGPLGAISRLAGGFYGSAVTFGALDTPSAPGQPPVAELAAALRLLYGGAAGP